jgi:hypothetical protein
MKKLYSIVIGFSTSNDLNQTSNASKKISSYALSLLMIIFVAVGQLKAQYTGTLNVPSTSFPTLKVCFDSLNQFGVGGSVVVNVTAPQTIVGTGNTATWILGSAVLNNSLTSVAGRTLTLEGNGNVITAHTGNLTSTITPTFTTAILVDQMWAILGTDNLTINNFVFTDPTTNTTANTAIEIAIGFHNRTAFAGTADGCQNVTISNCTFNFNDIASNAQAISASPHNFNPTGTFTTIFWTAENDRHRNFNLFGNTFNNCFAAARIAGVSNLYSFSRFRFNNNSANRIGGGNTFMTCNGVYMVNTDSIQVMNNTFSTDTGILNSGQITVIFGQTTGGSHEYINNNFHFQMRNVSSTTTALTNNANSFMVDPPAASYTVRKNIVTFASSLAPTAPTTFTNFTGFNMGASITNSSNNTNQNFVVNVDSNSITNQTFPGSGTFIFLTVNSGGVNTTTNTGARLNLSNNSVVNLFRSGGGGSTTLIQKSTAPGYVSSRISNNIIRNFVFSPTQLGNTTAAFTGITNAGTPNPNIVVDSIFNNIVDSIIMVRNIQATNSFLGIGQTSSPLARIFDNSVTRVVLGSNAGNSQTNTITGIQLTTATPGVTDLYRNRVENYTALGNFGTTTGVLFASNGTVNIFNNYIQDFFSPNSSTQSAVIGINNSSSGIFRAYNNTIHFGRTGQMTSTLSSFGGTGIQFNRSFTAPSRNEIFNNIVNINARPGSGASFVALRSNANGTLGLRPANYFGGNNIFHVNDTFVSATTIGNFIYAEGFTPTTGSLTNVYGRALNMPAPWIHDTNFNNSCSRYGRFMGELSTFNENNLSATGSAPNTRVPSGLTFAENSGTPSTVPTISPDFFNVARSATTPDRGALEFTATSRDATAPVINITPKENVVCLGSPQILTATVTDLSGVNNAANAKPRMYYRRTTDPTSFVAANNNSAAGWKWVEASNSTSPYSFTLDFTKFATPPAFGDTITYFVAAQDLASPINVSAGVANLIPATVCPSTVDIGSTVGITGATSPLRYIYVSGATPTVAFDVKFPTVCSGDPDTIKANLILAGSVNLAVTATTGSAYGQSPFSNQSGWFGTKTQYIIRASELTALGLSAGNINSLAINMTSASSTFNNFTMWLGNTAQADFAGGVFIDTSAMTKVYEATAANAAYTPTVGVNTFTVGTTPASPTGSPVSPSFVWNGTSNLVVCFAWLNTNYPTGLNCQWHTAPFIASRHAAQDWTSASQQLGAPTGFTSGNTTNRPNFVISGNKGPSVNPLTGYTWSPSGLGTAQTITPFPATVPVTKYYVTVADNNGCTVNDSVSINVNSLPTAPGANNSTQCGGGVPTCTVTDPNSFANPLINWFGSPTATVPLQSDYFSAGGNGYKLPVTQGPGASIVRSFWVSIQNPTTGCWSPRTQVNVTVNSADTFNLRANGVIDTISVCSHQPTNLTVTNLSSIGQSGGTFNNFTWTSPNAGAGFTTLVNANGSQTITPLVSGVYTLTMTANNAGNVCKNVKFYRLRVQQNPYINSGSFITTNPNPACVGTPVTHTLYLANVNGTFPNYAPALGTNGVPTLNQFFDIDTVILNGNLINSTLCTSTGSAVPFNSMPASIPGRYSNYLNLPSVGDIIAGSTNTMGLSNSITGLNGNYAMANAVFIDYNRNGAFEANERVLGDAATYLVTGTTACISEPRRNFTFSVPTTISSGPAMMRVMSRYFSVINTAVFNDNYGETEDYIVNLVGQADTTVTKLRWGSNATGATVLGTAPIMTHATVNGNTIYHVQMTNGVCIDSFKDTVTNNVPAFTVSAITGPSSACAGETLRLTVAATGGCIPYSYTWAAANGTFAPVAGGTLNNDTILFTPTGTTGIRTVNLTVSDNIATTQTRTAIIGFNNPTPSTITPDTICGLQSAILCATPSVASDEIRWFPSATSFNALSTGNCFTTPVLNAQTIYWARQFTSIKDSVMQRTSALAPTSLGVALSPIVRNTIRANKRLILTSVDIYPWAAAASTTAPLNSTIEVQVIDPATGATVATSGVRNFQVTANTGGIAGTATAVKIPIGAQLQAGTDYFIQLGSYTPNFSLDLGQNTAPNIHPQFPTASTSFQTIQGFNGNPWPSVNYYFWNYQIEEGCWGAAFPDTVKYVAPPSLALDRRSDSVCSGTSTAPVTLTSPATNYNTYTWALGATSPAPNVGGTGSGPWTFSEPVVGNYTYILNAVQTSGLQCAANDTMRLLVKTIPGPIVKNPNVASVDICQGSIVAMDAVSTVPASGKIGTGTVNTSADVASPFNAGWHDQRAQYIYTAAELSNLGIVAGNITGMGYIVLSNSATNPNPAFNIKISHIPAATTSLTNYITTGTNTTTVYSPSTFTFPAAGTFNATFDAANGGAPFAWDGTSNILVEVCQDNVGWGGAIAVEATTMSPAMSFGRRQDFGPVGTVCTSTLSTSFNPVLRPNAIFYGSAKSPTTWSPTTRLFNSVNLTPAYAGTARDSVWAAPNATTKYFMTATHPNGCAIQDSTTINVTDTVVITQNPATNSAFCIGDTMRLIAAATSNSTMTRQWLKGGSPVNPTNSPGLIVGSQLTDTLRIVVTSVADSGFFNVFYNTGSPCAGKFTNLGVVKIRRAPTITTQPLPQFVCVGSTFSISTVTTNDSSVIWTQIGGANGTGVGKTYNPAPISYADSGRYFFTVRGLSPCKPLNSDTVRVQILPPALISVEPPVRTQLCIGNSFTFKPTYTGGVQGFQWLKNGVAIPAGNGGTADSLTVTANTLADSGTYRLVLLSPTGCANDTTDINMGIVKVFLPVAITTQPLPQKVCVGSTFSISSMTTNDSAVMWTQIGGANGTGNGKTYAPTPIAYADSGLYFFTVRGFSPCPSLNSDTVRVEILPPATVTADPAALTTLCIGQNVTLKPTYSGGVQGFQWLKNGVAIPAGSGGTADTLTVTANTQADSGTYRLVLLSPTGCANDTTDVTAGIVKVNLPPVITTQPNIYTKICQNSPYTVSVLAQNIAGYKWYKDGVAIGTTAASQNPFVIPNTVMSDAGIYKVELLALTSCTNIFSNGDTMLVIPLAKVASQPVATTVCEQQTLSMSVTTTNEIGYQWLKNGVPMVPAQTGSSISISPAAMSDSAMYSVIAISDNLCKTDTSSVVLGAVVREIQITTQPPANSTACVGKPFTISMAATYGSSIQWFKNGVSIGTANGGQTNTLNFNPFLSTDTGNYTAQITAANSPCPSKTTSVARIISVFAAQITTEPTNSDFCMGTNVSLSVATVAANTAGYQWYKDGVSLGSANGANTANYSKANASASDAGVYSVIALAYSGCTPDTSVNATVTISTPLSISTPLPQTANYCETNTLTQTVGVAGTGVGGTGNFNYSWSLNGNTLVGNSNTYSKSGIIALDAGRYVVQINGSASCPSIKDTVDVAVNRAPQVNVQPAGTPVVCIGQNMVLTVNASNFSSLDWEKVGGGIVGSGSSFSKVAVATDGGRYRVRVNPLPSCVAITSMDTLITINSPAVIVSHPRGGSVLENPPGSYSMSVTASGTGPLTYQWFQNGNPIPNTNNRTYNIKDYNADRDSGVYNVVVTSPAPCSNAASSNIAIITTTRCPIITEEPIVSIERCKGQPFSMNVKADGAKSFQWFKDGVAVEGADNGNFSVASSTPEMSGTYTVQAVAYRNDCALVMSREVIVKIWDNPKFTTQPLTNSQCGSSIHTMNAKADYATSYQWYRNGIPVAPSGTDSIYTYTNVNATGDNFYVEARNTVCNTTGRSNTVNVKLVDPSKQVKLPTTSVFDLVERCTDASSWTYYSTSNKPDELLLAIKKPVGSSNNTARPDIEVLRGMREISAVNALSRGAVLGSRLFNIDFQSPMTQPYEVKFYFSKAEEDAVMNRFRDIKNANPNRFETERDDTITVLTASNKPFTNSLWTNVSLPLNIDFTIATNIGRAYGSDNGVKYIVIKRMFGDRSGGTLFMDYQLKSSSGIGNVNGNGNGFGVNLYPVPTLDGRVSVEVASSNLKAINFIVMDMTGRTIAKFTEKHGSTTSKHEFDFSELANGNYQMIISNDIDQAISKFTIAK